MQPVIKVIFAKTYDGGIGLNGKMPWPHLKEDMKHFRNSTLKQAVIMGRITYESLGSVPLLGRHNIIVTSSETIAGPCAALSGTWELARSLDEAIEKARDQGFDEVWVIGGKRLFEEAIPRASVVSITTIHPDVYHGETDVKLDRKMLDSVVFGDFDSRTVYASANGLTITEFTRRTHDA